MDFKQIIVTIAIFVIVVVFIFFNSHDHSLKKAECKNICNNEEYVFDVGHRSSDKCYCKINGDLILKKIF